MVVFRVGVGTDTLQHACIHTYIPTYLHTHIRRYIDVHMANIRNTPL